MTDFTGLIKFSAEWCGPCKAFSPVVKKVTEENDIHLQEIDIDKDYDLAEKYGIRAVPAMLSMIDGEPQELLVGAHNEEAVKEFCIRSKLL